MRDIKLIGIGKKNSVTENRDTMVNYTVDIIGHGFPIFMEHSIFWRWQELKQVPFVFYDMLDCVNIGTLWPMDVQSPCGQCSYWSGNALKISSWRLFCVFPNHQSGLSAKPYFMHVFHSTLISYNIAFYGWDLKVPWCEWKAPPTYVR